MHQPNYDIPCTEFSFKLLSGFSSNENETLTEYLNCIRAKADLYPHRNLLITAGYDFAFEQAEQGYTGLEKFF